MREKTGAIGKILENLGQTGIKSINRYTYTNTGGQGTKTIAINGVDPAKCIVLVERVLNTDTAIRPYTYVLNADHIYVSHATWTSSGVLGLAFTVVEFYAIGGE